jgi:hypothetical protein
MHIAGYVCMPAMPFPRGAARRTFCDNSLAGACVDIIRRWRKGGHGMRTGTRQVRWIFYTALFVCAAWVSLMGYRQVTLARSEKLHDVSTWVPKTEIVRLMRFHGTDGLKITQDEVFIYRGEKWIPVRKRNRG